MPVLMSCLENSLLCQCIRYYSPLFLLLHSDYKFYSCDLACRRREMILTSCPDFFYTSAVWVEHVHILVCMCAFMYARTHTHTINTKNAFFFQKGKGQAQTLPSQYGSMWGFIMFFWMLWFCPVCLKQISWPKNKEKKRKRFFYSLSQY